MYCLLHWTQLDNCHQMRKLKSGLVYAEEMVVESLESGRGSVGILNGLSKVGWVNNINKITHKYIHTHTHREYKYTDTFCLRVFRERNFGWWISRLEDKNIPYNIYYISFETWTIYRNLRQCY